MDQKIFLFFFLKMVVGVMGIIWRIFKPKSAFSNVVVEVDNTDHRVGFYDDDNGDEGRDDALPPHCFQTKSKIHEHCHD